ncbi:GNAT family N-acetyltransferase [Alkalicoccus saliphilus]|uniref:GNAT family N-acetyltransferase n=1 Tax=Alkalicoccus saliphilus TaxID=200989 RepID=A0A2T4U6G6_9BACI|nr:GNAT family protein [Alkalicoccus saliphilus]PTL38989.1 GNAT family N-acetyltransferase [Alkalicoccus saliphilus]
MIYFKKFTTDDIPQLIKWINAGSEEDMFLWSGITFTFPIDEKQLLHYAGESDAEIYSIWSSDHKPCGHAALRKIDTYHRSARIGKLFIAPEYRGLGITPIILQKLLYHSFSVMNLNRVGLGVFADNERALSIYRRFGFHIDGRLRDYRRINDRYIDLIEMSVLYREFTNRCRSV